MKDALQLSHPPDLVSLSDLFTCCEAISDKHRRSTSHIFSFFFFFFFFSIIQLSNFCNRHLPGMMISWKMTSREKVIPGSKDSLEIGFPGKVIPRNWLPRKSEILLPGKSLAFLSKTSREKFISGSNDFPEIGFSGIVKNYCPGKDWLLSSKTQCLAAP